ncbi:FliH/SctL family protein [Bordetella sp. 15P40C-2]|uniref:FliH/SctL family protein n=1 Tax=Bordetella sp. 15P40C-2 TaxID=2572246 RepID=UPI0013651EAA|nr:FliH/SctL family protein [Bordetella sp. 15P40C-2]
MYKRPTPLFKPVTPPPTVLSDRSIDWSRWTMAPIARHEEEAERAEQARDHELEQQAIRQREQEQELARLREQARQEGYAAGREQGLAEGREQGRAEGHAEGYAAGMASATDIQQQTAQQLMALLDAAQQEIVDLREEIGQSLIAMGVRIASHIVGLQLADPGPSLLATVRHILSQHEGCNGTITFYLNDADLALLRPFVQSEQGEMQVRLVAAADLSRGDIKARTAYGDIDATLKTRWDAAMASIGLQAPPPAIDAA